MKKSHLLVSLLALGASTLSMANGFVCNNDHRANKPQWSVRVFNSAENKPSTFVLATGKQIEAARTIARVEDNRRITLSGRGEYGTTFGIILRDSEPKLLKKLADQRLTSLASVNRVNVWVDWDSGEEGMEDGDKVYGYLELANAKGEQIYRYSVICEYDLRGE